MNNYQIGVLSILGILMIIGYFGTALSKNNGKKMFFIAIWMVSSLISLVIAFVMTSERERLLNQTKGKCPEYQKIDNVYILKNTHI